MKIALIVALAALVVVTAVALRPRAPAYAQSRWHDPGLHVVYRLFAGDWHRAGWGGADRRRRHHDPQTLARWIAAELDLDAAQRAKLEGLAEVGALIGDRWTAPAEVEVTGFDILRGWRLRLAETAEALDRAWPDVEAFYQSLDERQRAMVDAGLKALNERWRERGR